MSQLTVEQQEQVRKAIEQLRDVPASFSEEVSASLAKVAGESGFLEASDFVNQIKQSPLSTLLSWALALSNGGGSMVEGVGDPVGVVTPDFLGQLYHDGVSGSYYHSISLDPKGWILVGPVQCVVHLTVKLPGDTTPG